MPDDDKPIKNGRGYPPVEHQYPPGVSGNILGRPVGSKNKKKRHPPGLTASEQIAIEEAERIVKTSDGEMEAIRAVTRSQMVSAIKGGSNAQRNTLDRIDRVEATQLAQRQSRLMQFEEYKQQYELLAQTGTKHQLASLCKGLLPHPEDVEVDFDKGTIAVRGPSTTLERKVWNEGLAAHTKMRDVVLEIRREVAASPTDRRLNRALLVWTDRFMRRNDQLPERYRLKWLPIWKRGASIPFPALEKPSRRAARSRPS